jgi:outer membrane lipoprotein carrier protein
MRSIRACQRTPGRGLAGARGSAFRRACRLAPLFALLAFAAAATAGAAEGNGSAATAARRLEERLAAVKGVEADFVQTLDTPALPEPQVESGRLFLERPGRMRWEYQVPKGKLALADGKDTWLWLPEDQVAITTPLAGDERDSGVSLLMRERIDVLARFTVDWGPAVRNEPRPLRLKPKTADAPYDALLVDVDPTGFPRQLTVLDSLGGRVTYRLSNLKFTDHLDPALFRFTPPPGATIQRASAP